jgi:hypothetical protein
MVLKDYVEEQTRKTEQEMAARKPAMPTGVACTETWCDGEMMWTEPRKKHPELKVLARAICGDCGWKGWI